MHGCLQLMLGQRYTGTSTGCQGGMSKPQGSEWIYSPASILFGPNGLVVPSQCVINNTERWTGSKEKAGGQRKWGAPPPPLIVSLTPTKHAVLKDTRLKISRKVIFAQHLRMQNLNPNLIYRLKGHSFVEDAAVQRIKSFRFITYKT